MRTSLVLRSHTNPTPNNRYHVWLIWVLIAWVISTPPCLQSGKLVFTHPIQVPESDVDFFLPGSPIPSRHRNFFSHLFPSAARILEFPTRADQDRHVMDMLLRQKLFVWALRGGYGSAQLWSTLELHKDRMPPKVIVGYSDVTFLHLWADYMGWPSLHAMMPYCFLAPQHPENWNRLKTILMHKKGILVYKDIRPLNQLALRCRYLNNFTIIGGNLSILSTSIGTPWQIRSRKRMIFIEEVSETPEKIKRYLLHLKQSGVFKGAKAILIGDMPVGTEGALKEFANTMAIPVFHAPWFGHGFCNSPLPFGSPASIQYVEKEQMFQLQAHYNYECLTGSS